MGGMPWITDPPPMAFGNPQPGVCWRGAVLKEGEVGDSLTLFSCPPNHPLKFLFTFSFLAFQFHEILKSKHHFWIQHHQFSRISCINCKKTYYKFPDFVALQRLYYWLLGKISGILMILQMSSIQINHKITVASCSGITLSLALSLTK